MNVRRIAVIGTFAALSVAGFSVGAASAGIQVPHDMVATPSTGPVGQVVVVSNAANSKCGGQQGDVPTEVALDIIKPDHVTDLAVTVPADSSGNWTYSYTTTDQVGTYTVEGSCADIPVNNVTSVAPFDYTNATFDITAVVDSSTTTSSSTPPATAPPAAPAPTKPTFTG